MRAKWLGRVATAAGAVVAVGLAAGSPGWANATVDINSGNVPTTASGHADHECNLGGGPFTDRDVWVFVLPGNHDKVGDFVSVTAQFDGNATLNIPADGGAIITDKGTSKAWIAVPAGWTLTDASAVITGTADKFNLTHTCPASGGGQTATPTPPASEPPSTPGSPSPSGTVSESPSGTVSESPGGGSAGADGDSLPVTGAAVTSMVVIGVALVAGGIALLVVRRRRDLTFAAEGGVPARGGEDS
jgi:LPXTG-motif cell wall-anchored protein